MRTDTAAMAAMLGRFETACRRLMKINLQEYEEGGESLLYSYSLSLNADPPPPRGMYPCPGGRGRLRRSVVRRVVRFVRGRSPEQRGDAATAESGATPGQLGRV